jgi:hypothetical protein
MEVLKITIRNGRKIIKNCKGSWYEISTAAQDMPVLHCNVSDE